MFIEWIPWIDNSNIIFILLSTWINFAESVYSIECLSLHWISRLNWKFHLERFFDLNWIGRLNVYLSVCLSVSIEFASWIESLFLKCFSISIESVVWIDKCVKLQKFRFVRCRQNLLLAKERKRKKERKSK